MAWPGFRQWVSGIQGQLVLGLLAVVVVISVLNTLVASYLQSEFFTEAMDSDARQHVAGLAKAAEPLLAGDSAHHILATLESQIDGRSTLSLTVYDAAGAVRLRVPADAPPRGTPPSVEQVATGVFHEAFVTGDGVQVWRHAAPVMSLDGATIAGVLELETSLAVLQTARQRSLLIHLLMLAVLGVAGLAVSLLAARRISAPIRQLANHAEAVSMTVPTDPVPTVGAREIQALARAMNRMLGNLHRSMARLRESEARYRGLFDRMPDVALELDADGVVLAVNSAVDQLGLAPAEVVGQPVRVLVADADAARVTATVAHAVGGGALTTTGLRLRAPGAEQRWGELRVALRDRGDDPERSGTEGPRLVAILRDVTERKRADDEVAHAQRVLSIHTLASGISHEFNNVMATIIGTGSLLLQRPDLPDEVARELGRITEMARRGADLSAQVLSYTRRSGEQVSSSDLADVIRETMDLLVRTLDKRIEILVDSPPTLPPVKGDPTRLQQVLLNVGINAGDAMPEGGTLRIDARPLSVTRKADADRWGVARGEYVDVAVRDSGAGMDRAVLARIFEPYFTTKQPGEGTGLGLSVVYGTIRGLGGGVDVESVPAEGTTFHLLLPVADEAAAPAAAARARRRPTQEQFAAATGQTILVVEDEPDLRELSRRVLERRGYRVYGAADGFEAEAIMRDRGADVDLVLLDVNLPRRDGAATYDVLRGMWPALPVVIVSAGGVTDHRISGLLRRGALTLLRKPYEFEELLDVVVQALTGGDTGETPRVGATN